MKTYFFYSRFSTEPIISMADLSYIPEIGERVNIHGTVWVIEKIEKTTEISGAIASETGTIIFPESLKTMYMITVE